MEVIYWKIFDFKTELLCFKTRQQLLPLALDK